MKAPHRLKTSSNPSKSPKKIPKIFSQKTTSKLPKTASLAFKLNNDPILQAQELLPPTPQNLHYPLH